MLATIFEDALETGTEVDPTPALDYAERTGGRVVVVNGRGISQIDTLTGSDRDFSTRPEFNVALGGAHSTGIRHSDTLDADLLFVSVPVASGGIVFGAVRLTFDTEEVTARVREFWWGSGRH